MRGETNLRSTKYFRLFLKPKHYNTQLMNSPSMTQHKTTTLWPYAIIAAFVLFIGYIGFLVKGTMSSSEDLVSKDYYQKEIAFQQHINSVNRTAQLSEAVGINYDAAAAQILVSVPAEIAGTDVQGTVQFFRPSDLTLDFQLPLQLDAQNQQQFSTTKLAKGFWKVRLSFTSNGQDYYKEQKLVIK